MKLTSKNVNEVILDCLFREDEETTNMVVVEGLTLKIGFHPERLESHREDIISMIGQLPDTFLRTGGGGYTFLGMCETATGEQWTSLHRDAEELFVLGLALKVAQFCIKDREMWSIFPSGMPYVVFDVPSKSKN